MIDPRLHMRRPQCFVGDAGPALPRPVQLVDEGFEAAPDAHAVAEIQGGLRAQSLRRDLAGGREQMRMEIARVPVDAFARCMHRQVDGEPMAVGEFLGEVPHQRDALGMCQFRRQRHHHLARHARVAARLGGFGRVPERCPVARPVRREIGELRGQENLLVHDVAAHGVVVGTAGALVADPFAGAIGTGTGRAAAVAAAERLHIEDEDRHTGVSRPPEMEKIAGRRHSLRCPRAAARRWPRLRCGPRSPGSSA